MTFKNLLLATVLFVLLFSSFLKVKGQAPPTTIVPCMKTNNLELNCGYNFETNAWYGKNAVDEYWGLVSAQGASVPRCATVWGEWTLGGGDWGPMTQCRALSVVTDGGGVDPEINATTIGCNLKNGKDMFTFRRSFWVDIPTGTTIPATLNLKVVCDDRLNDVRLGPTSLGITSGSCATTTTNVTVPITLKSGKNNLDLDVLNRQLSLSTGTSPMEIKVQANIVTTQTVPPLDHNYYYKPNLGGCGSQISYMKQPEFLGQCIAPTATSGLITISNYGPAFTYKLLPGNLQIGNGFNGTLGNSYTVTVTDGIGCSVSSSVTIVPNNLNFTFTPSTLQCVGQGVKTTVNVVNATGGTSPYLWSCQTVYNSLGIGSVGQLNQNILSSAKAPIGNHAFTVKDQNGCASTKIFTVGNLFTLNNTAAPPCAKPGIINPVYLPNPIIGNMSYKINNGAYTSTLPLNIGTAGAGTYTITAKDDYGCTVTSTRVMFPNPVVTSTATNSTCPITLTAQSSIVPCTYQWNSPNGLSSTISNSNQATLSGCWGFAVNKSYTVTATDGNACTGSTVGQYTEDPFCCPACITACPSGNSANMQLPPSQWNNTLSHKFSNNPLYNNNNMASLLNSFGNPAGNVISTNDYIVFDGTLNITQDLTFVNCPNIYFKGNARFVLQNGATLRIDGCKLRTLCHDVMWDGIYATSPLAKIAVSNSDLYDMNNGIVSTNGGKIIISSNTFINNNIGITIRNAPVGFNFNNLNCQIGGNTFTSSYLPCAMIGVGMGNSSNGIFANIGIRVIDSKEVEIGHLDFGNSTNTFTKIYRGIHITSSIPTQAENYYIYDNVFEDMKYPNVTELQLLNGSPSCIGIYCNIINNTLANHTLHVDYDMIENFSIDFFRNVDNAIYGLYNSAIIKNVKVRDVLFGFLFNKSNGQYYRISDNKFKDPNIFTAIEIIGSPKWHFKFDKSIIENNLIYLRNLPIGVPNLNANAAYPSAIHVICDNTYNGVNGITINNNNIRYRTSGGFGICVENGKGNYSMTTNTVVNDVTNPEPTYNNKLAAHFAWLNCTSPYMYGNNSIGNTSLLTNYNVIEGLRIENSKNSRIMCNTFTNTRIGTQVVGDCEPSFFETNAFKNHGNAIRFGWGVITMGYVSGANLMVGSLGQIGDINNDYNNTFTNSALFNYPINHAIYRWGNSSYGNSSKELYSDSYTQSISGAVVSTIPPLSDPRYIIQPVSSTATIHSCALQNKPAQEVVKENFTVNEALDIINDTIISPDFNDEIDWLKEGSLFYAIADGDSFLLNNPTIKAFYDEQLLTKRDELFKVDDMISSMKDTTFNNDSLIIENYFNTLVNANNLINGGIELEVNEQQINYLLIKWMRNTELDTINEFSQEEKNLIELNAYRCPLVFGNAVYKARMLYATYHIGQSIDNIAVCSSLAGLNKNGESVNYQEGTINGNLLNHVLGKEITIFPNPANDEVTIDYSLLPNENGKLKLYDVTGRIRKTLDLTVNSNRIKFSVADLETGVYLYKYDVDNRVRSTGKLTIE